MKATPRFNDPVLLSIAGSDCSSGAGIQADMKSASAQGVYALTAVTCVVSEVPGCVSRIQEVDPDIVEDQVRILLENFPVGAVKTGMLYSPAIVRCVSAQLEGRRLPLVVDPVMIATSGDSLMRQEALDAFSAYLLPLATLVTPNLDETAVLLGWQPDNEESLRQAAYELSRKFGTAFLVKGGHLPGGEDRLDVLATPRGESSEWRAPFIEGVYTHGTGCTYSAAIAAGIAKGMSLSEAIERAHAYIAVAIRCSLLWDKPTSMYALNHFHEGRNG